MIKQFDEKQARKRLNYYLRQYKINVIRWRMTSSGKAYVMSNRIEIPQPVNIDRFGVCMHEIKHIIDGHKGARFIEEFDCDMFARNEILAMGWDTTQWDKRMNWHSLYCIAKAHNRKYDVMKLPNEIKDWFSDVDFSLWKGKRVYIQSTKEKEKEYLAGSGYKIFLREGGKWCESTNRIKCDLNSLQIRSAACTEIKNN